MDPNARDRIRDIKTFSALVEYLRDELEWPIEAEHFDEVTFDYAPEELGINPEIAAKITVIKQLRPLTANQPWGVFFVEFEPKRLPVVALRRVLRSLVVRKRKAATQSQVASWALHDLLFISAYGEDAERQLTFAHFSEDPDFGDLPTLRVLGWDDADTALHIDHVHDQLHSKLAWPEDEDDIEAWRETWSSAFTVRHREVITTSRGLAQRLAELARVIRSRVNAALAVEVEQGPTRSLMKTFKEALIHDLRDDDFADMYAQTVAYGLLSARVSRPAALVADDVKAMVPITNPFLRDLLDTFLDVGGRDEGLDFDELGVNDVVEVLRRANMEAVLRDFGNRNPDEDPVIHFYELFLKEYDPQKRMKRGVFYTPRPVVSFIVRSVDEILRTEFGLPDGLADTTTWGEMQAAHTALTIPRGVKPNEPFVQVLDPATGTGTFLVEVIEVIHNTMVAKWQADGCDASEIQNRWNEYVPQHLLPRLFGFELLMAPYAIAHMKIGLKLAETGYRFGANVRVGVFLTNALEPGETKTQVMFADLVAEEAHAAAAVKQRTPITLVIGNPPYANYSANLSSQCRGIVDKYRGYGGQPIRERNQLQFERNIQDDYVKFIALAEDFIANTRAGVIALITNATILFSPSLRGAREHLRQTFSELHELHLHGGTNETFAGAAEDQNVFEIEQPVAIHVYAAHLEPSGAKVWFGQLQGSRRQKEARLLATIIGELTSEEVALDPQTCAFIPQQASSGMLLVSLDSAFVQFGAGIKTNQDAVAIAFDLDALLRQVQGAHASGLPRTRWAGCAERILYRPFDIRYVFYDDAVVASRSWPTMQHMLHGSNVGIAASSSWTTPERFSILASRHMVEMKAGTNDRGTTLFPIYRFERVMDEPYSRCLNLSREFLQLWKKVTGLDIVAADYILEGPQCSAWALLCWIYACCHSPIFRRENRTRLSTAFPQFPLPRERTFFESMATLGERLVLFHLLETDEVDEPIVAFPVAGANMVQKGHPKYYPPGSTPPGGGQSLHEGRVYINGTQRTDDGAAGQYFEGVSEALWGVYISGYPALQKWLKDRRGCQLTDAQIQQYRRIVVAVARTLDIMAEIDDAINGHGGFPDAFAPLQ